MEEIKASPTPTHKPPATVRTALSKMGKSSNVIANLIAHIIV
jgi:hypothetical protein